MASENGRVVFGDEESYGAGNRIQPLSSTPKLESLYIFVKKINK